MLTTRRAFVVVLDEAAEPSSGGGLAGKVEHLPSGESTRFESSTALIRFIESQLFERKGE